MTIDQLRDRFDRLTDGDLPTPDLADAIAGGRRKRRASLIAYVAGSSAVAVVAVAVVAPHLAGGDDRTGDRVPTASDAVSTDASFVPGTDIDERLAAAVATEMPMLPAPADVFPMDWRRPGNEPGWKAPAAGLRLPDEQFGEATAWQLRYDIEADHTVLITVATPVGDQWPSNACTADGLQSLGPHVSEQPASRVPTCFYMDGQDEPSSPAYLMQTSGEEPSSQDAVMLAFTERVEDGTEAEGKERALFKGYPGLELINALDLAGALQPHE
jgi:hypothetical protein